MLFTLFGFAPANAREFGAFHGFSGFTNYGSLGILGKLTS
jgi:hypothetical protein